jgi:hypothetical protein
MEKLNFSVFTLPRRNTLGAGICVGNSGLFLDVNREKPGIGTLHFTPEGNNCRVDSKRVQYALTFMMAIKCLCDWFRKDEEVIWPETIEMNTNLEMASFLENHLQPAISSVNNWGNGKVVEINVSEML